LACPPLVVTKEEDMAISSQKRKKEKKITVNLINWSAKGSWLMLR